MQVRHWGELLGRSSKGEEQLACAMALPPVSHVDAMDGAPVCVERESWVSEVTVPLLNKSCTSPYIWTSSGNKYNCKSLRA